MKRLLGLAVAVGMAVSVNAPTQAQNFDDPVEFAKQQKQLTATPMGPEGKPWLQYLDDSMVDTSSMAVNGKHTVCFSNAGVNNPWRVVGYTNMTEEVAATPNIGEFIHVDAEGSDDKQIADIDDLLDPEGDRAETDSVVEKARELESNFATEHPNIERFMREVIDVLVRMGI